MERSSSTVCTRGGLLILISECGALSALSLSKQNDAAGICPEPVLREHESLPRVPSSMCGAERAVAPCQVSSAALAAALAWRGQAGQDDQDVDLHRLLPGQHQRRGRSYRAAVRFPVDRAGAAEREA